ncbi:MAG: ABC transporter ATP-binding protein/permease [Firmicutes bacterium]|nr:ABC transporter ATP-binding protein/permease [Bacillota bacterium]
MQDKILRRQHFKQIKSLFKSLRLKIYLLSAVMAILSIITVGLALLLKSVIDQAIDGQSQQLLISVAISVGLLVGYAVCQVVTNYFISSLVWECGKRLRMHLHDKVLARNDIEGYTTGDLIAIAYDESLEICQYFTLYGIRIIIACIEIAVYVVLLWMVSYIIALVVIAATLIFIVFLDIFNKKLAKSTLEFNKKKGASQTVFLQGLHGFWVIKFLQKQTYQNQNYQQSLKEAQIYKSHQIRDNAFWQTIAALFHKTFPVVVAILVTYLVSIGYASSMSSVMLVYLLATYLITPIVTLTEAFKTRKINIKAYERIKPLLIEQPCNFGDEHLDEIKTIVVDIKTFGYADKIVLRDLQLEINKGDSLSIVGESGKGKTTLLKLLLNQLQLQDGAIYINGTNIQKVRQEDFYNNIGFLSQMPFMFEKSIRENIMLGDTFSQAQLDKAILDCGLTTFIQDYGLDKKIDEKNENLSGGQLQRVALARVLIRQPKVIILDEPTSALDKSTATSIMNNIFSYAKDCNIILICVTHDIELAKKFAKVVQL